MKRMLSLVLDDEGRKSLVLYVGEARDIDEFTTKKFENSNQIREYFKNKIDPYLQENAGYLQSIQNRTGKNYKGRIVILEMYDSDRAYSYRYHSVLYKKHIVAFKEMIKDCRTMQRFLEWSKINYNYNGVKSLISPFLSREIKIVDYSKKSRVELIGREIRKHSTYYEILRLISKAYLEERKKRPHLKTIEKIYSDYLTEKNEKKALKDAEIYDGRIIPNVPDDGYITIDGVRVPIDEMPDLDNFKDIESINFWLDGLGDVDEEKYNSFH